MAPILKILMSSGSKKGTPIYYPFHSKSPGKPVPSRFPSGAPMDRDTCLHGIFTPLLMELFFFPLESPVRELPPCSLTESSWTGILHHQSHCPAYSFIHSCMSAGIPTKEPSYIWEKHKVTVHGDPRRRKAYIQWGTA